ncbi:hypothetical protein HLPCO_000937 [Haloplasma contractile SSD-17B]|uniref:Uncharacterized protein n=1 Tax=Haloplasma contractile SSD-17B TaxID=1033810 RepID=U2EE95_9MOLU|nr:hypothetical protein HLPCO_000937 [Haloplasma contractile SSD-17B]
MLGLSVIKGTFKPEVYTEVVSLERPKIGKVDGFGESEDNIDYIVKVRCNQLSRGCKTWRV